MAVRLSLDANQTCLFLAFVFSSFAFFSLYLCVFVRRGAVGAEISLQKCQASSLKIENFVAEEEPPMRPIVACATLCACSPSRESCRGHRWGGIDAGGMAKTNTSNEESSTNFLPGVRARRSGTPGLVVAGLVCHQPSESRYFINTET